MIEMLDPIGNLYVKVFKDHLIFNDVQAFDCQILFCKRLAILVKSCFYLLILIRRVCIFCNV